MSSLAERIIAARDDFKNRDMFGARYLAEVLSDAAQALAEAEAALENLIDTFTPTTPLEDPVHGADVAALGRRIGFGALMTSAAATWRDTSSGAGGEFVVGPCALTADIAIKRARQALNTLREAGRKGDE